MMYDGGYVVFIPQVFAECIGSIHASVLTAGTAKIYREVIKPTFNVVFNGYVYHIVHVLQEILHPCLGFEEIYNAGIASGLCFKFL